MLRITVEHERQPVRLVLEGALGGPWVDELRSSWKSVLSQEGRSGAVVDLENVHFVDSQGKALLTEMYRKGAQLTASGIMTQAIVDEIVATNGRQHRVRRNGMKRLVLIVVLLIAAQLCWGQQTTEAPAPRSAANVLTLEAAVRLALDNNRQLKIAALEVSKASEQIVGLKTRRLPAASFSVLGSQLLNEVDFTVDEGTFGNFPSTGPIPDRDTHITTPRKLTAYINSSITQPLSQFYEIHLNIQQAGFSQEMAKQKLREQQASVVNSVKKIYYSALEAESALEASRESLQFYREMDRLTEQYVLQQVVLKSDSLDVKAQLAKESYDVMTLEHTIANRKEQLNQLLGRDLRTELSLEDVPAETFLEVDLASAQARALEQRPEISEAGLKVSMAKQDERIKRAENIPDVSLAFNYISPFGTEFLPKNVASVGVQLKWEPWDWGRKKSELAQKSQITEQAQLGLRDAEALVLAEVSQQSRTLAEARALLLVANATRESAREKLRVVKNQFAQKASLLKNVLQIQAQVAESNHTYRQALLSFWTARADFEKALGE
jgi:outer membrane protein TolC/ABC-type transporter Mla MlaB component